MNIGDLTKALNQTDAGLFFLAGLDFGHDFRHDFRHDFEQDDPHGADRQRGVVTVHASAGALGPQEKEFLAQAVSLHAPGVGLRLEEHAADTLKDMRSLQALAARFSHQRILADPTGSFSRLNALLETARALRSAFPGELNAILWEPQAANLAIVPDEAAMERLDEIEERAAAIVAEVSGKTLAGVIKSVDVGPEHGNRRYTPVDDAPDKRRDPLKATRQVKSLKLRLAAIAAMIGLGTAAAAGLRQDDIEDTGNRLPGMSALIDLTTLGESAFGTRNRFKAAGGLRLFFGDMLPLSSGAFAPRGVQAIEEDEPASSSVKLAQAYGS